MIGDFYFLCRFYFGNGRESVTLFTIRFWINKQCVLSYKIEVSQTQSKGKHDQKQNTVFVNNAVVYNRFSTNTVSKPVLTHR